MSIYGLSDDEQRLVSGLLQEIANHRSRNEIRRAHMDCKKLPKPPPTVPPYLRNIGLVLGWPAKAVEALARRARLTGFAIPGSELSTFGIDTILDENEYVAESRMAQLSALEFGVSWLVATRGGSGEPDVLITRRTALDGTGTWNVRARRLSDFLSVNTRDTQGQPKAFNLYLPGQVVIIDDKRVQDRVETGLDHIPVEPLVYRQRDGRPFGSSRITRPIMGITQSAIRTMLRSEGTADFYGAPLLALFGPDQSLFDSNPALKMLLSMMFAVPDNEDAENPRADLKQLTQGSQQPHISQLQVWAQLFAAEANIPVTSLGVNMSQSNPTSDGSYEASREDLIGEAEDTQDGFARAHVRIQQTAWMIATGEKELPAEMRKLQPIWRDARHGSKAGAADWLTKTTSVLPWIAETDTALDLLGLDELTVERLRGDKRRAELMRAMSALGTPGGAVSDAELDASEIKAKADAMGVLIRAGVDPDDAAEQVGLPGVRFRPGLMPASLVARGPATEE